MKKVFCVLSLFLFPILFSAPAVAVNGEEGNWEFGPYVGAGFPDHYRLTSPDIGFLVGGRLGYSITSNISSEVSAHRVFSRTGAGADANFDSYRLNVLWNFRDGEKFRPFVTVGGGLERADLTAVDEKDFAGNIGAGFKWYATDSGGIRLEGRYVPVKVGGAVDSWEQNVEALASVFLQFGKKASPAPVATPTPEPTPAPAKPSDADGDGVLDENDKCPNTPAGTKVDETGCPIVGDADNDGVKDDLDKCPETPTGTKVDEAGCPMISKARGILRGVNFKFGKADLTPESSKSLDEAAAALQEFPQVKVEVQGHTDPTGNEEFNKTLSQARAQSVLDYLVGKGINKEQLTAKGYGSSKPLGDNQTSAGRKQNRRVELNWLDN